MSKVLIKGLTIETISTPVTPGTLTIEIVPVKPLLDIPSAVYITVFPDADSK
jgi:hypothetical protein